MAEKIFEMTREGYENLEKELDRLITVERPEVIERIKIARSYGDLSENSEYESARNEQALLEGKIAEIEKQIRFAQIVDSDAIAEDEVSIGKKVTFIELPNGEEEVYYIVGSAEANPLAGKISNESPVASAMIGKKIGDEVNISTPSGEMVIKIVKVEKH
ncbi:transcription elongation factor GreA [Pilibacter termitis]|uniref:Transcription elongation factor GreA n=1 Tax=Pilibacter termitis TaxID=263852 RepID=A0A1T4P2U3_9ENTE|nr:transcription elongation factor GreA [Pilibacter termitis]SJZ85637.1 transcription elongation factor GreA [Pilibacter termitis]